MDTWLLILLVLTISIYLLLRAIFNLCSASKMLIHTLPPGPYTFPIIGNMLWIRKSFFQIEPILRNLRAKHGPMITLHIGPCPSIFVFDRSLSHQVLVQSGSLFSDRPKPLPTHKIMNSNQHKINSAPYGPTWRILRRNLTSKILRSSCIKSYSYARKWVLDILVDDLQSKAKTGEPVEVLSYFRFAMFGLLLLMCFADKLSREKIKEIESVMRRRLQGFGRFSVLNVWPRITRKRWRQFLQQRKDQEDVLVPLIRARKKAKGEKLSSTKKESDDDYVLAYVDTLLDLELPKEEGKRKLEEGEIVTLTSELLNTGTDTTSTSLQWVMANLVKYPCIQEKLLLEMKGVMGDREDIKEDDLQKMAYLKAVILEGLRRHPPGHFVLPHCVRKDTVLGGYLVPKNGTLNFMVADMGLDPKVWKDPMAFKPERFMESDQMFDITGSREIKMMPFGAGRRICPGLGLALLHMEYFVANLIWKYQWKAMDGDEISLEEKQEFTVVMKNPLMAHISLRK